MSTPRTVTTPAVAPLVKFCGLTRPEDAAAAEAAGAAYLGAILAGGPRLLTPARARDVLGPRRHNVRRVAVFGDQPWREVLIVAGEIDVDVVQLHGARAPDVVARISAESGRTVWPVLRVAGTTLPEEAAAFAQITGHVVLDAHVVGQLGGTGVALDWSGLRGALDALREAVPDVTIVLAGGLRPANVAMAIQLLSPHVVDVSSGVETAPGVKDPALVQQFVMAARGAAEMQR
ncbi:phosphoribosylanthranilate isomerase [Gemmatimonas sp.]|uniref:phosphoribosylanthranilate isomerase n=1 Tax=Gemmatimonas sp. TaxID=1962908 RepID=UPI00333FF6ED